MSSTPSKKQIAAAKSAASELLQQIPDLAKKRGISPSLLDEYVVRSLGARVRFQDGLAHLIVPRRKEDIHSPDYKNAYLHCALPMFREIDGMMKLMDEKEKEPMYIAESSSDEDEGEEEEEEDEEEQEQEQEQEKIQRDDAMVRPAAAVLLQAPAGPKVDLGMRGNTSQRVSASTIVDLVGAEKPKSRVISRIQGMRPDPFLSFVLYARTPAPPLTSADGTFAGFSVSLSKSRDRIFRYLLGPMPENSELEDIQLLETVVRIPTPSVLAEIRKHLPLRIQQAFEAPSELPDVASLTFPNALKSFIRLEIAARSIANVDVSRNESSFFFAMTLKNHMELGKATLSSMKGIGKSVPGKKRSSVGAGVLEKAGGAKKSRVA